MAGRPGKMSRNRPTRATVATSWVVTAILAFAASACGSGERPVGGQVSAGQSTMPTDGVTGAMPEASTPARKYLSDAEPVASTRGADTGAAEVNGKGFARSITVWVNQGGPVSELEYNLGRDWKFFRATIGLRDDSPSGGRLTFEVVVDGEAVYKKTLPLGQTQEVNVRTQGALRLKLTVTDTGEDTSDCYGTWGDARLEQ